MGRKTAYRGIAAILMLFYLGYAAGSKMDSLTVVKGANINRLTVDSVISLNLVSFADFDTVKINKIMSIDSTRFIYFGDSSRAGTWRIGRVVDSLKIQRLESGNWVNKNTIAP